MGASKAHEGSKQVKDYDRMTMTLFQRMWCGALSLSLGLAWGQTPPDAPATSSALTGEWLLEILLGELQVLQGDPGAGYSLLLDAALKSGDEGLYERAIDVALRARAGEAALRAASAWRQAAPKSASANRRVLQIQLALQRLKEAQVSLRLSVQLAPEQERAAVMLALPSLLSRASDKALAAQVLADALAPWGDDPAWGHLSWTAMGQARLQAGDAAGALQAVQRAHRLSPSQPEPIWLALDVAHTSPEALSWLEGVMSPKSDPTLVLNWSKLLIQKGRLAQAEQVLLAHTQRADAGPRPWLVLGALRQEMKNTAGAQEAWQRFLKEAASDPKLTRERDQALMGLAQASLDAQLDAQAQLWLSQVSDPDNLLQARLMQATALARKGQLEQGRQLISTLPVQTQKQELARTMTEVQYLRQFKQWQAVYDLLSRFARQFEDEDEVSYELALAAEKVGKLDEMETLLKGIIEDNPKFHQAYNALGYSLADRNIRLDEAKKLILQAVGMAPDDPFIADSLGWVEFRLGRKPEALKILQSAFQARADAEIAAHLGEVLWSMDQKDQALDVWRRGLRQDADNETLVETLRRLGAQP